MLNYVKQASCIERPIGKGQAEDRALNQFGPSSYLVGANYDPIHSNIVLKAISENEWG
jgi:hypothetical protein